MSSSPRDPQARSHRAMLGKLALLAVLMFGFGFAMVPLYKKICEVTGINWLTKEDRGAADFARNTQVDTSRRVTIEFDANHHGAWRFRPQLQSISVFPGELVTVEYELVNTQPRDTAGQAIPSYAPAVSAQYLRKLECFCFRQQALGPLQTRRFPVVFVVDPRLPADVTTITMSYTFFELTAPAQAETPRGGRGG